LKANQDYTLTARFEKNSYSVDVQVFPSGAGTISPSTHGTYKKDTSIELEAHANNSYVFSYWSGEVDKTSANPLKLNIDDDYVIEAHFKKKNDAEDLFYLADNGVTVKC